MQTTTRTGILDLPPELRNRIYGELFGTSVTRQLSSYEEPALSRVSHVLRGETLAFVLAHSVWFTISCDREDPLHDQLKGALTRFGPRNILRIRHIRLCSAKRAGPIHPDDLTCQIDLRKGEVKVYLLTHHDDEQTRLLKELWKKMQWDARIQMSRLVPRCPEKLENRLDADCIECMVVAWDMLSSVIIKKHDELWFETYVADQANSTSPYAPTDYRHQLHLLEQHNKRRVLMRRQTPPDSDPRRLHDSNASTGAKDCCEFLIQREITQGSGDLT